MFGIGPLELVMILVVALLVFGPKRVPELARTLGKGLAEFRRASNELRQSLALDEIQQDLRRDLGHNQTIHRPPPGPGPATPDDAEAGGDSSESGDEAAASAGKHPGELPLGNDHEHHDEVDEAGSEVASTSPSSAASESPERTKSTPVGNSPADPELGNVPVSESGPPESRRG